MMKKISMVIVGLCIVISLMGCGVQSDKTSEKKVLNIAYQYGLAYAPLTIAQEKGTIEAKYKELTGEDIEIVWIQMSSGADINTGITSGTIDVGFMGVGPAVTGVTKGIGYKIFTNMSGQEHGLMCNDDNINSLEDLVGSDKQVALVNIGSIQHIILAKTLSDNGYDPHILDANLVSMKHPDGSIALETGNVTLHLTTNPYLYKEREEDYLHELPEVLDSWSVDNSFIVGVASQSLYSDDSELYEALCEGISEAVNFINTDIQAAAEITAPFDGNTVEDEVRYMELGKYTIETSGIYDLAVFMADNGFIDSKPTSYSDLVFDNVKGD